MAPIIADHWEHATFPHHLIPKLSKLNLGVLFHEPHQSTVDYTNLIMKRLVCLHSPGVCEAPCIDTVMSYGHSYLSVITRSCKSEVVQEHVLQFS